jgi:hypothetical protein
MRPDMHKVIVERPRQGSRGPFRGTPWEKNAALEDLPRHEGVRKAHSARGDMRSLNENLAPLRRYLFQQVGRHWDAVYSEISERLRATSAVQQHVRDHVWDYVERNATLGENGAVFEPTHRFRRAAGRMKAGALYIHPTTGRLCAVKAWR